MRNLIAILFSVRAFTLWAFFSMAGNVEEATTMLQEHLKVVVHMKRQSDNLRQGDDE